MSLHSDTHGRSTPQAPDRELPRDAEQLIRLCKEQGWQIEYTNSGHTKLKNPTTGRTVIAGKRLGDYRAVMNMRAELKRAGLRAGDPPQKRAERMERPPTPPMVATLGDIAKANEAPSENTNPEPESADMKNGTHGTNGTHEAPRISMPPPAARIGPAHTTLRVALLSAIARADQGKGVTPADVVTRMMAVDENQNVRRIGIAMAGACTAGHLVRRSIGRYSVAPAAMTPQLRAIAAAPEVIDTLTVSAPSLQQVNRGKRDAAVPPTPPVTDESTADDVAILEAALAALANIERVILKHKAIATKNSELVALLSKFSSITAGS